MKFLEGSPEPIAHAAIDGADKVVHVFNARMMAEQYATAGGYKIEAVFRGVPPHTKAAQDVLIERWRQTSLESFSYQHDDKHENGELAKAGIAYALAADSHAFGSGLVRGHPSIWPWSARWWKPDTVRRMLVKACALLLAEIERLDRKVERDAAARVPA
ncbi:hypothetical protein [Antarcticirhabdus aurantiaca]|uniref:Uncharacterized protein n=1 Tax=Antarcticirhabdus aurantiaca TaxID=2606717 RepID=A0ACD4NQW3_9HYPH|nr:hypothetical protein OXU80_03465 [Jeongeuplla avenae]